MNASETSYWAAMAQVLPVLGVGLVIEFRTLILNRRFTQARWHRRIQSIGFTVAAFGLASGTTTALTALKANEAPGEVSSSLAVLSAAWALGMLIWAPVLELAVRTNPGSLAWLFTISPKRRLWEWRLRWMFAELAGQHVALRSKAAQATRESEALVAQISVGINSIAIDFPRPWTKEVDDVWDGHASALRRAQAHADVARKHFRQAILHEVNLRTYRKVVLRQFREAVRADVDAARRFATDVVRSDAVKPVPTRDQPDDGGFLHPQPAMKVYPYRKLDFIATDPEVFMSYEDA